VILNSVERGVERGFFGLGIEKNGSYECLWIEEEISEVSEDYFIIERELCKKTEREDSKNQTSYTLNTERKPEIFRESGVPTVEKEVGKSKKVDDTLSEVNLNLKLPKGKALEIGRLLNLLDRYFEDVEISISAKNGKMANEEYELRVLETLKQLGILD
jgi:hypothetical protein